MLVEPQVVTINAVANSLPRVGFGNRTGSFANADESVKLSVDHVVAGGRNRRTVRLDLAKTAADPLLDGVSRQYTESVYIVVNHPKVGYTTTETINAMKALRDFLSDAQIAKIVGGES